MVKVEYPRVIHPLVSFTFTGNSGLPFSQDAGKGKCCMYLETKLINDKLINAGTNLAN